MLSEPAAKSPGEGFTPPDNRVRTCPADARRAHARCSIVLRPRSGDSTPRRTGGHTDAANTNHSVTPPFVGHAARNVDHHGRRSRSVCLQSVRWASAPSPCRARLSWRWQRRSAVGGSVRQCRHHLLLGHGQPRNQPVRHPRQDEMHIVGPHQRILISDQRAVGRRRRNQQTDHH